MVASVEARLFRDVMGYFATGVTVVTAQHGEVIRGMTANAVTSVSLDPPLVLVAVSRTSSMFPVLNQATSFAVNILAREQEATSTAFAHDGDFARLADVVGYHAHSTGAPVLDGVIAYADCEVFARYDGGDHELVLGEVVEAAIPRPEASPLLFFRGAYGELSDPPREA